MKSVLITTTSSVDGAAIERYLGVTSAHVVAGTGLFSDIAASFRDLFGGRSASYQKQLEGLNQTALEQLSEKARRMGADAVIGARIDYDEVSGKNVQMFMVTATGTAVKLDKASQASPSMDASPAHQSAPMPGAEILRRVKVEQIMNRIERDAKSVTPSEIETLVKLYAPEAADAVSEWMRRGDRYNPLNEAHPDFSVLKAYFSSIPAEDARRALEAQLLEREVSSSVRQTALDWIVELELTNYASILRGLREAPAEALVHWVFLARTYPQYLTGEDAAAAAQIKRCLEELPDRSEVIQKRGLMGSSAAWKCAVCETETDASKETCENCQRDRRAVRPKDVRSAFVALDGVIQHVGASG